MEKHLTSQEIQETVKDLTSRENLAESSVDNLHELGTRITLNPKLDLRETAESCMVQENLIASNLGEIFVLLADLRLFRNRLAETLDFIRSSPLGYAGIPSTVCVTTALETTEETLINLLGLRAELIGEREMLEQACL